MGGRLAAEQLRQAPICKRRKRLGDLGLADLVVVDHQPLEERLVPLATQMSRRGQVGALTIGQEVECLAEHVLNIGDGSLSDFELTLGLIGLGGQPILLLAQQVDWHRPGVVGMEQLLALLAQLDEALALANRLGVGLLSHPAQRPSELHANALGLLAGHPHVAVYALNRRLDQVHRDVRLLAASPLLASDAEEVGVAPAVALGIGEAHPRAATSAEERALQIVVVLSVLLGSGAVRRQYGLRFEEGGAVDQRLMATFVIDPRVADDPNVVGVLEDDRKPRARKRQRRPLLRRSRPQSALGQCGEQSVQRVSARAVGGEGPPNVGRSLGVDLDRADFLPLDHLADIEVAEWSAVRRPA